MTLLEAVERVALAVTLLAHQAEVEADLSPLWKRWQDKRTELLRRADGKERLTNIEVSLELSIASPRMTEGALRLLSLLGLLPDGIAREDLEALLPGADEAAGVLRQVGLAFVQEQRLRALAPVREYVHRQYQPGGDDQARAIAVYVDLAQTGERVGKEGGVEAVKRLSSELGNIDTMLFMGLESSEPRRAVLSAQALAELMRFTGLGTTSVLERARKVAKGTNDELLEADCIHCLGEIELRNSDYDAARQHFEEALPLFRRGGSLLGEANCNWCLGEIDLRRSDYDAARQHYEEALPLFRRIADPLGEANCIKSLGDIDLGRSSYDAARQHYEEALPLYKRAGFLLGQANCIKHLGEIALLRSDYDTARQYCEEALPLYRCIGALLGEAHCIKAFGDIALLSSDQDTARTRFEEALSLYERISDSYSIGFTHEQLARIAPDDEIRRQHVEAAQTAWESIKLLDLVEELRQEFSDLFPDPSPQPALQ
ncbi:MAG TPA: tetratricopeptide repeat protein [Thermoanaerobaculia bacterium]|nr:tetratricopeptide repeat protein [Thermoanaerobaculia bacterium]